MCGFSFYRFHCSFPTLTALTFPACGYKSWNDSFPLPPSPFALPSQCFCSLKFILLSFYLITFHLLSLLSDTDECNVNLDNCHTDANCLNTDGSFYCQCMLGYTGNGIHCTGELINTFHGLGQRRVHVKDGVKNQWNIYI